MKIYVASSWKNAVYPTIVDLLKRLGHDVYDFRHPAPGNNGFSWAEVSPKWEQWTPAEYQQALRHPKAERGYALDIGALRTCDAVVYVLPCGRSASWELGYAMGQGKSGYVVCLDKVEPDLMFREATFLLTLEAVHDKFLRAAS